MRRRWWWWRQPQHRHLSMLFSLYIDDKASQQKAICLHTIFFFVGHACHWIIFHKTPHKILFTQKRWIRKLFPVLIFRIIYTFNGLKMIFISPLNVYRLKMVWLWFSYSPVFFLIIFFFSFFSFFLRICNTTDNVREWPFK